MKKLIFLCLALFAAAPIFAQDATEIVGKWETIDDETKEAKSIVEIVKGSDGKYYGKIIELKVKSDHSTCVKCKGDRKNKPLVGLEIIRGMKKSGSEYKEGTILDPASGKEYKSTIKREGNKLHVRGYVGIPTFGRTQVWNKK